MWSWGRKSSDFCDKCAEAFPELVNGRCTHTPLLDQVMRRLEEFEFCERCFASYRRTVELCGRRAMREMPEESGQRLLAKLRELRDT
jgi:hypothetical protein